jgi:hypothetical protein
MGSAGQRRVCRTWTAGRIALQQQMFGSASNEAQIFSRRVLGIAKAGSMTIFRQIALNSWLRGHDAVYAARRPHHSLWAVVGCCVTL